MKMQLTHAVALAATLTLGATAGAAVIAEYDFDTQINPLEFPNNGDVGPWNVSPTFQFGAGITSGGGAFGQFSAGDTNDYANPSGVTGPQRYSVQIGGPRASTNNQGAAVAANDFFGFTLSPLAPLNLDTFFFTAVSQSADGVILPAAPESYAVFVGAPGFDASAATPLASGMITGQVTAGTGNDVPFQQIVVGDISTAAYDNISSDLEFRIYLWGGASGAATLIDNVILTGAVVPEPASLLSVLGLGSVVAFRRRR